MESNPATAERILASRIPYLLSTPSRGDVVVVRSPSDPSKSFVKRIIGLPGDQIEIHGGRLYLNRNLFPDPYRIRDSHGDYGPEKVKQGYLFVLGDNRDNSNDSRS